MNFNILQNINKNETRIIISKKNLFGPINFLKFKYLIKLDCSKNYITSLIDINKCSKLTYIDWSQNRIINLDNLPNNLRWLFCSSNPITSLDNLPYDLEWLNCSKSKISKLDNLPQKLKILNCFSNKLENLKNLPLGIIDLNVCKNNINSLDYLPCSMKILYCANNKINNFDNLPNCIKEIDLRCNMNDNIYMNNLPLSIQKIYLDIDMYKFSNCAENNIKESIPIKNIDFKKWKLKKNIYGDYLESSSVQNVIKFSPTEYNKDLDKCMYDHDKCIYEHNYQYYCYYNCDYHDD